MALMNPLDILAGNKQRMNPLMRSHTAQVGTTLKVWIGTWNMGNAEPKLEELKQWLPRSETDEAMYDLVVLGVQESTFTPTAEGRSSVNKRIRRESVKFVGELDAAKLQDEIKKKQEDNGANGDTNDDSFRLEMDIDDDNQREELEALGRSISRDGSNSGSPVSTRSRKLSYSDTRRGSKIIKDEDVDMLKEETTYAEESAKGMQLFDAMVQATLGFHYRKACSESLGPMKLRLFMNVAHKGRFHNVHKHTEATGLFHLLPNKGGILISISIDGLKLCFISAHLNAQHDNLRANPYARNDDVCQIFRSKQKWGISTLPVYMQHHHTIFMGDLNYRIDLRNGFNNKSPKIDFDRVLGENHKLKHGIKEEHTFKNTKKDMDRSITPEEEWRLVNDFVRKVEDSNKEASVSKYKSLLKYDELKAHMKAGLVFENFREGEINFPPTFKCKIGTEGFKYTEQKHRTPSYCDRILFTSCPGFETDIEQMSLNACRSSTTSDHKPSFATFSISIPEKVRFLDHAVARLKITNLDIINLKNEGKDLFFRFYSTPNGLFKEMQVGRVKSEVPRTDKFFPTVPIDNSQIPVRSNVFTFVAYINRNTNTLSPSHKLILITFPYLKILHCNLDSAESMAHCSIIFVIFHHDSILKESLGEHNTIVAYGQVPLEDVAMTTGHEEDKTSTHAFRVKLTLNGQDLEGEDPKKKVYLEGEMRAVWDIMEDLPEGKFAKDLANVSNGCCEVQ